MATITEDYVSFEVAKLLRDKGFNEPCYGCYFAISDFPRFFVGTKHCIWNKHKDNAYYSAPTLQMAMKWLVREHRLYVNVAPSVKDCHWTEKWHSYVEELNKRYPSGGFIGTFNSHEQACEEAIKYCLKHLIK